MLCVMRKLFSLLALSVALFSCQRPLFESTSREGTGSGGRIPPPSPPDSTRYARIVYSTAVVFPDSVNWRKGQTQGAKLVLFKDTTPVQMLEADNPPQPDRHTFQDGHFWTFFTDGSSTTVSCDGNLFFEYPGEESPLGFLVAGGEVHTLGQHPGGGFCYRVNGQEVFSSPQGMILSWSANPDWEGGALSRDETGVYYSYALPVKNEEGEIWEYRVMKGGEIRKMIPAVTGSELHDIRVLDGTVYRLENRYGRLCYIRDETLTPLTLPEGAHNLRLTPVDGIMGIKGFHEENRYIHSWIRDADSLLYHHSMLYRRQYEIFARDQEQSVVILDQEDCVVLAIRDSTMRVDLPNESYRLHTPRCVQHRKGTLALALTGDTENEENMLLVNEKKMPMPFNGYFTGIYIE